MRGWMALNLVVFGLLSLGVSQRVGSVAPAIAQGGEWFNSAPTTLEALRGKVILLEFWTFGCYNCDNSLATLKTYYSQYKTKGFEILGVHTPEFDYEKSAENLKRALVEKGIDWPVVQDNQMKTWRAYGNRYWPAFYLIDKKGTVRLVHAGEISSQYPKGIGKIQAQIEQLLDE